MKIQIAQFKGTFPRISDRLMGKNAATVAEGCRLESGEIRPFRQSKLVEAMNESRVWSVGTIHRWNSGAEKVWLRFPGDVDVVNAPLPDDVYKRVYWTGDSRYDEPRFSYTPNITNGGEDRPAVSYKWGIPAPTDAPLVNPGDTSPVGIDTLFKERPIRIKTTADHGLETGEIVEFSSLVVSSPASNEENLLDLLGGAEFQVTVLNSTEFTLDRTDAENVQYNDLMSGFVAPYTGPDILVARSYVYTYVSDLGEEGPPSPPSTVVDVTAFNDPDVTIPTPSSDVTTGRQLDAIRIYRTNTGTQSSQFQFVAEIPIAQSVFTDNVRDVAETVPSVTYDPPPADLKGIRVAAQGFIVGFFNNVLCFSEPYLPHAWPTNYQIALDYRIVAIEVIDNGVVVATEGKPYLIQGIEPRSMTPRRLEIEEACVSARSMASLGYAAVYAGANGLVYVDQGGARLLTRGLISDQEWPRYQPETLHGHELDGQYIGFYGSASDGGGLIVDPKNIEQGVIDLNLWCRDAYRDTAEPYLYLLTDDETVVRWDDPDQPKAPWRWKSKRLNMPYPLNVGAAKLTYDAPTGAETVTLTLYADGKQVYRYTPASQQPFPMPAGYLARDFDIEIEGDADLQVVELAESLQELDA